MGDWIFDSVVGYMSSPLWNAPVATFVENNCVVFDSEEENKLEYTQIHAHYKEMIENLLENFLVDLGISPEQFAGVMETAASGAEGVDNEAVFASVIAADDFQLFKTVMVKKNVELEMQVRALYQAQVTKAAAVDVPVVESVPVESEEDAMMREALRLSLEESAPAAGDWDDVELAAALEASRREQDELAAKAKAEQAELAAAVNSSLKQVPSPKKPAAAAAPPPPPPAAGGKLPSLGGKSKSNSVESHCAAAAWMSSAAQEAQADVAARPKSAVKKTNEREERKKYLQEQRQKLLEKRNQERNKGMQEFNAKQGGPAAAAAKPAAAAPAGSSGGADFRKALAARLKREVVKARED